MAKRLLALLSLAGLLAGCAGALINPYYSGNFVPTEAYDVKVVVSGAPVADTKVDVPEAVVAAMRGQTAFPVALTLLPPGTSAPYRAIIMFEPPPGVSTWLLCREPLDIAASPPTPEPLGRLAFSAALCRGDGIMSGAYGYIDRLPADDPRFQEQIAAVTHDLFPAQNPELKRGHGGRFRLIR